MQHGRASLPRHASGEERGLVVPARGEPRRVQRHGDDELDVREARLTSHVRPEQLGEGGCEVGPISVLQPVNRLSQRTPEGKRGEGAAAVGAGGFEPDPTPAAEHRGLGERTVARNAAAGPHEISHDREPRTRDQRQGAKKERHAYTSTKARSGCVRSARYVLGSRGSRVQSRGVGRHTGPPGEVSLSGPWRFTDEHGVEQTIGTEELRAALSSGKLPSATLVWRDGMDRQPAFTVAELASAAIAAARRSVPPASASLTAPRSALRRHRCRCGGPRAGPPCARSRGSSRPRSRWRWRSPVETCIRPRRSCTRRLQRKPRTRSISRWCEGPTSPSSPTRRAGTTRPT